MITTNHL